LRLQKPKGRKQQYQQRCNTAVQHFAPPVFEKLYKPIYGKILKVKLDMQAVVRRLRLIIEDSE